MASSSKRSRILNEQRRQFTGDEVQQLADSLARDEHELFSDSKLESDDSSGDEGGDILVEEFGEEQDDEAAMVVEPLDEAADDGIATGSHFDIQARNQRRLAEKQLRPKSIDDALDPEFFDLLPPASEEELFTTIMGSKTDKNAERITWTSNHPFHAGRTDAANLIYNRSGPTALARAAVDNISTWSLFINEIMISDMLLRTNQRIDQIIERLPHVRESDKYTHMGHPAKYGVLYRSISESVDRYTYYSLMQAGKPHGAPNQYYINTSDGYTMYLVDGLSNFVDIRGRNISLDRFFTSIPVARECLERKITIVGTVKSNRRGIPKEILQTNEREAPSTKVLLKLLRAR
eukprot:Seg801.3 transcript_id=Seg801.3/GoldUCD/mRNA.D3Y31 product="hypothetical protein" protein_id=Seg801.3/GoldUCD/D3Y31